MTTTNLPLIAEPRPAAAFDALAASLEENATYFRNAAKAARTQDGSFLCVYNWKSLAKAVEIINDYAAQLRKVTLEVELGNPILPGAVKGRSTALKSPATMKKLTPYIQAAKDEAKRLKDLEKKKKA